MSTTLATEQTAGLTEAEAARRLAASPPHRQRTSRSYASIVRANVFTVFNLILAAFGVVTLVFGDPRDALFLGIIVANSGIGIFQEVRAKRALDRLSLLVAPQANVRREGTVRTVPVEQVVLDDVVLLAPGDQLIADGVLLSATDLRLDESVLTGESAAARRETGDEIRSGAFVVEGSGTCRVTAIGAESFAARITGEARSFRHPRSPLERAINRLLYALVGLVVLLGALLGYSLYHRHVSRHTAVATSTAGVVTLIPEGLMVLVSLTYAAAAVRMSRRGVLAQQLNAIESLASVDTICVDKTGTLTEAALRVIDVRPAPGVNADEVVEALRALAGSATVRNITLEAIAEAYPPGDGAELAAAEIPFSSRRRYSAVSVAAGTLYLGAPERLASGELAQLARGPQGEGRRVLAVARSDRPLPHANRAETETGTEGETETETETEAPDDPPSDLEPLGLVVLAEELRPNVRDTIAFLHEQNVAVKVLSGDAPETVAAIARDVGIAVEQSHEGSSIPDNPEALRVFAAEADVIGRISPEGKQAVVRALAEQGRYVAMVGDGVNDVPALKASRLAIAQGTGTQMARSVSDLVLISGDFAAVPPLVAEGRRALRNLQRVTKLYVTKSAFAAFLILTIGTSSDAYPLLPRHLSLAASLTIGIPTFFLALAPSSGAWRPEQFVRGVARFAVPAGTVIGTGVVAGYLFAIHDLDMSLPQARTVALTTLIACGLYLVMALESGGGTRRSALVAGMCAAMAALYVLAFLIPFAANFYVLASPTLGIILTSVLASAVSICALALCGFTLRVGRRAARAAAQSPEADVERG